MQNIIYENARLCYNSGGYGLTKYKTERRRKRL